MKPKRMISLRFLMKTRIRVTRTLKNFLCTRFFVPPPPPPRALLLRLTQINSIQAEIDMRKLLFWGYLVTEPKMAPSVRNFLRSRAESFYDKDVKSIGILPSICEALNKYDLFNYFEIWFNSSTFPKYGNWKSIVKNKVRDMESTDCGWNFVLVI